MRENNDKKEKNDIKGDVDMSKILNRNKEQNESNIRQDEIRKKLIQKSIEKNYITLEKLSKT